MRTSALARSLSVALVIAVSAPLSSAHAADGRERVRYDGWQVVRLTISSAEQLDQVDGLGARLWSEDGGIGEVEYLVSRATLDALAGAGFAWEVVHPDVQGMIDEEAARLAASSLIDGPGTYFLDYRDYATTSAYIDTLVALNPAIASRFTVGNSIEGRAAFGIRISSPGAEGSKPGLWIESIQHAREWATLPVSMWAADQLVRNYGTDPLITTLVDSVEFYIVPIVNPDGYVYTWGPNRLWRKNRRPNAGGSFGVDLNRNWSDHWGGTGSSGTPSSETYRGTAPLSEPETLNIANYIGARPHIRGLMDFHSNAQIIILPRGWTNDPAPELEEFMTYGTPMAAAIQAINGLYHAPGSSGAVLYLSSGNVRDWAFAVENLRPMTVEVRTGSSGFTPPASSIAPTNAENWAGIRVFAEWVVNTNPVRFQRVVGDPTSTPSATPTPVSIAVSAVNGPAANRTISEAKLWWRAGTTGGFTDSDLTEGAGVFSGSIPGAGCAGDTIEYYYEGTTVAGQSATFPAGGSSNPLRLGVGDRTVVFSDNFDGATGWTVGGGDTATAGAWTRVNPVSNAAQPEDDNPLGTGTTCYITANGAVEGNLDADVDNGFTTLTSPIVDGTGEGDLWVSYYRWFSNNLGNNREQPSDTLLVQVSNNGGALWTTLETVSENTTKWTPRLRKVSDVIAVTNQMRIRFRATDTSGDSCVEAGVDDVVFFRLVCDSIPGDVNGDGVVNFADLNIVLSNYGVSGAPGTVPGDANGDGVVNFEDLNIVLSNFGAGT